MSNKKQTNRQTEDNLERKGSANSVTRRKIVIGGSSALAAGVAAVTITSADQASAQSPPEKEPKKVATTGKLKGKVAIVTGAALGIGRACTLMLASEGADIVAVDFCRDLATIPYPLAKPEDLAEVERLVKASGRRFLPIRADVRNMEQMRSAVERGIRELGKIDILVANAGVLSRTSLADMTDEELRDIIDVNLIGYFNSIRAVIPHMMQRKQGRIVALSSTAGRFGIQNASHYGATKWGIIGLVKSAALELGEFNITVNAVAPTRVNTRQIMNETVIRATVPNKPNPTREDFAKAALEQTVIPVPWVEPEDVADSVLYLVSDESKYITGAVIDVALGINARYTG